MHGPALTRHEVAFVLHMNVERFERLGIPRKYAVPAVAKDNHVSVEHVVALVEYAEKLSAEVAVA